MSKCELPGPQLELALNQITTWSRNWTLGALGGCVLCAIQCRVPSKVDVSDEDSSTSVVVAPDTSVRPNPPASAKASPPTQEDGGNADEVAQRDGFRGCMRACSFQVGVDPGPIDRRQWCVRQCSDDLPCVSNCQVQDGGLTLSSCRIGCVGKYPMAIPTHGYHQF